MLNKFLNPYYYIPLPKKREQSKSRSELLTGKFIVEIDTKTPIHIPDTEILETEESGHEVYDFFHYNNCDDPVIPGSEIRGLVRSVYEALTGSCLSAGMEDHKIYKKNPDTSTNSKESQKGAVQIPSYENTINRILETHGGFQPCSHLDDLCPACSLFGTVIDNKKTRFIKQKSAAASRVRFTDTCLKSTEDKSKNYRMKRVTLPFLTNPKLTATEFYVKKPEDNAVYWDYDGWRPANGNYQKKLDEMEILGRKFYWHWLGEPLVTAATNIEKTSNNRTIVPVELDETSQFIETVYFEDISQKELEQLFYILNISEDGKSGYKIGYAKPFGYGSITMRVKDVVLRQLEIAEDIDISEVSILQSLHPSYDDLFLKESKSNFEKLVRFDSAEDYLLHYPLTAKQLENYKPGQIVDENFRWFNDNKKTSKRPVKAEEKSSVFAIKEYMDPESLCIGLKKNEAVKTGSSIDRNPNKKIVRTADDISHHIPQGKKFTEEVDFYPEEFTSKGACRGYIEGHKPYTLPGNKIDRKFEKQLKKLIKNNGSLKLMIKRNEKGGITDSEISKEK